MLGRHASANSCDVIGKFNIERMLRLLDESAASET